MLSDSLLYVLAIDNITPIYDCWLYLQYLEHRFSKGVRTAGSMTFCFQMVSFTERITITEDGKFKTEVHRKKFHNINKIAPILHTNK